MAVICNEVRTTAVASGSTIGSRALLRCLSHSLLRRGSDLPTS